MTREEVIDIINKEELSGYNFFEKRYNQEYEVVITQKENRWIVYATDERASAVTGSEQNFDKESLALESFIARLRALNLMKRN
nr:hypothetical protein [Eubacterium sp.]